MWALLARSQLRGRGAGAQGSGVERSGAAQGLAEVLAVLGPDHLAALLPDILQSCRAQRHFEREGALTLFKFLPLAVPDEVQVGALCCFAATLSNPWGWGGLRTWTKLPCQFARVGHVSSTAS